VYKDKCCRRYLAFKRVLGPSKEEEIHKQVQHPHILPPIGPITNPRAELFMVYPYLPKHIDVLVYLMKLYERKEMFPTELLYHFIDQMTEALHHVHQAGYVHMDVSLENILHQPHSTEFLLIDWDLSRQNNKTHCFPYRGKKNYMSPEQRATPGHQAHFLSVNDWFQLGVCIFIIYFQIDFEPTHYSGGPPTTFIRNRYKPGKIRTIPPHIDELIQNLLAPAGPRWGYREVKHHLQLYRKNYFTPEAK